MDSAEMIKKMKEDMEQRVLNRYSSAGAKFLAKKYLIPAYEGEEVSPLEIIEEASVYLQQQKNQ